MILDAIDEYHPGLDRDESRRGNQHGAGTSHCRAGLIITLWCATHESPFDRFSVCHAPEDDAADVRSLSSATRTGFTLGIIRDARPDRAFKRVSAWLADCLSRHDDCKAGQKPFMPTRLLDLERVAESGKAALVVRAPVAPYACLNYCWGTDLEGVMMTHRENLAKNQRGILISALPKTRRRLDTPPEARLDVAGEHPPQTDHPPYFRGNGVGVQHAAFLRVRARGRRTRGYILHDQDEGRAGTYPGSFEDGWMKLVQKYSESNLTMPSDKLVALSGLAQMVQQQTIPGSTSRYMFGVFENSLPEQLVWKRDTREEIKTRAVPRIAPSWSWASVPGRVIYMHQWDATVEGKEVFTRASFPSAPGEEITLQGPAVPVK